MHASSRRRLVMMAGPLTLGILVAAARTGAAQGSRTASPAITMLGDAMTAVAQLIPEETLDDRLNQLVQNVPAAQRLGARWNPSEPAFAKARRVVIDRIRRVGASYASSGALTRTLDAEMKRMGPDADAAVAALRGPAVPAIVRQLALLQFTTAVMADSPTLPKPGDPQFSQVMRALRTIFDLGVGAGVPKDDGAHTAEAMAFLSTDHHRILMNLCSAVVGKAVVQIDSGINLMMFDERQAIAREIEAIVAAVK